VPSEGVWARTTIEVICGEVCDPSGAFAKAFIANPCSPLAGDGRITSGRFWVLADDSSKEEEKDLLNSESASRERYICNSILTNESSCSDKKSKREEKKRLQRWATKELAVSPESPTSSPPSLKDTRSSSWTIAASKNLVLSPSSFLLNEFHAADWITIVWRDWKFQFLRSPVRLLRSSSSSNRQGSGNGFLEKRNGQSIRIDDREKSGHKAQRISMANGQLSPIHKERVNFRPNFFCQRYKAQKKTTIKNFRVIH
jgi:hypothetical protein